MPPPATDPNLHLDSLQISGFRGIPHLAIPRLGRVTLLAGKNGVGKTAVLDAVRIFAAAGWHGVIADVLRSHGEILRATVENGVEVLHPNWNCLFYGRDLWAKPGIKIGPSDIDRQLSIRTVLTSLGQATLPWNTQWNTRFQGGEFIGLQLQFQDQNWEVPIEYPLVDFPSRTLPGWASRLPLATDCQFLGPSPAGNLELAKLWDDTFEKDETHLAIAALELVLDAGVERIAAVGDTAHQGDTRGRRMLVKIKGQSPVSLESLGDGATRLFGVALAIANNSNGFLLIDEAENGIHHSIQQDFWKLVLQAAEKYNVQVLATTHSWDCVVGFAKTMQNRDDADGVYLRLEKGAYGMRAVEYSRENLAAAAKYGIETR